MLIVKNLEKLVEERASELQEALLVVNTSHELAGMLWIL